MSGFYYATGTIPVVTNVDRECIEEECQIWDATNSRCGMMISDINIDMKSLHDHLHAEHEHELQHPADSLSLETGADYNADYNTKRMAVATVLIQEMLNNQDLDNNGAIYWVDFIISNDDVDKPGILKTVESGQNGTPSDVEVYWEDFLDDNIIG
jgi:hypothetical protein